VPPPGGLVDIAGPVGHAGRQVALEAPGQAEALGTVEERDEHIMHHVLRQTDIQQQRRRQGDQIVFVLVVDTVQDAPVAAIEPQDQVPVFQHRTAALIDNWFSPI
jgi:hypothetical protein